MSELKYIKFSIRRGELDENGKLAGARIRRIESNIDGDFSPMPHILHALQDYTNIPEPGTGFPLKLPFQLKSQN